jgi:hydroxymethylpyrimidine pyrophosphatase-like HAD family hydrolase
MVTDASLVQQPGVTFGQVHVRPARWRPDSSSHDSQSEHMRYLALVTDYDGTIATHGSVPDAVIAAVRRLRSSGRHAILATGRRLEDLLAVCRHIDVFSHVIAENGAVAYDPNRRETTLLAEPIPREFLAALENMNVGPLEIGSIIVSTHSSHQASVLRLIQASGLELKIVFNGAAMMVLPTGINKASGTRYVLRKLGLSPHEIVAIGDAENDHSILQIAECPVAVANAIGAIKGAAAFVTQSSAGDGVIELIDDLIATDLGSVDPLLHRHHIALGTQLDGTTVWIPPFGCNILIAGPSTSGKSTFAAGLIERLISQSYQVCVADPEGDYLTIPELVSVGDYARPPRISEILAILRDPDVNVNVNLLGVPLLERPNFFATLFLRLQTMRALTGRPHWLVFEEAHHLVPSIGDYAPLDIAERLGETLLVTVHPQHVAPAILSMIDVLIAVGPSPDETLRSHAIATCTPVPPLEGLEFSEQSVTCWFVHSRERPFSMKVIPCKAKRIRHLRKYAAGDMGYHSFYFRGPGGMHNLAARNLGMFCHIARGIDEETWEFHLRRGDYSRWLRETVKDGTLADVVRQVEVQADAPGSLTLKGSRGEICDAIESRYTLPE